MTVLIWFAPEFTFIFGVTNRISLIRFNTMERKRVKRLDPNFKATKKLDQVGIKLKIRLSQ